MVAALGLDGSVTIEAIPAAERQAMADALGAANLAVLLSDYEAHPVAIMEALAVSTPVLVTRTSGLVELVDDGLAAGLEPGATSPEVAGAIVRELDQPRRVAVRLPTWDDCAAQLRDIYRQTLEGQPCGS
jgi:glycosyltransferase involved in cell wall biosynthesis